MSGQQIGAVIGGAIGAYFGGPAGAQLGMAIGGAIGGAVDPTEINGPHIGDGQQQSATDGSPIAWVMGTAKIAGTISWVGERFEVKIKDSGKGGPEVSHYESRQSFAICVCESSELRNSTVEDVLVVEQDGVIVYDVRPGSTIVSESLKWIENIDFTFGAEDQLAHPTIEAAEGVGNTPAYRGRLMMVATDFDIYSAGDRIPNFSFVVSQSTSSAQPQDMTLEAPVWGGKDQYNVVGGRKDFPLSDKISGLKITAFDNWAYYRLVVVPIYAGDPLLPEEGWVHSEAMAHLDQPNKIFDTGWLGHRSGTITDQRWQNTWGGDPPDVTKRADWNQTHPLPMEVPVHGDVVGIRYINFYWFDGFNANGNQMSVTTVPYNRTRLDVTLQDVVDALCRRGGLSASNIDTTDLSAQKVQGYTIARQCNGADALRPLLQTYFCFGSEYDGVINFERFGADATMTVDPTHLIVGNDATDGAIQETTRNQATEFPRKTIGSYTDPAQNYNVVTVMSERSAVNVVAIGEQQFAMPVVMAGDDARKAVDKALKVAYAALEGTRDYVVPFAYGGVAYLQAYAGMPVLMDGKRWVVDDITIGDNFLKFSTRYDRQSAYTSDLQAIPGIEPTPPVSRYGGPTDLLAMNLPILRDQDTIGLYVVARGRQAGWRKADIQISVDGKETWETALTVNIAGVFGTVADTLPSSGEPLTVDVGDGVLENVTTGQLAGGANAFAVAHNSTQGSVGQFQYADKDSTGVWDLTNITDGLKGSAALDPAIGDSFMMLDNAYFIPLDSTYSGKTIWLRATANGEKPDEQTPISLVYHPDTDVYIDGGTPGDGLPPPASGDV